MIRFNRERRCPICGGCDDDPRGKSRRCWGFRSDDGRWVHCMRVELAGDLSPHPQSGAYVHRLTGECRCGRRHDGETSAPPPRSQARVVTHQPGQHAAVYAYRDEERALLFQVVRKEPKGFRQRRPRRSADDPAALRRHGFAVNDVWVWSLRALEPSDTPCPTPTCGGQHREVLAVRLVLYRLPELLAADPEHVVYIVEGEKDVEALVALGLVATTNPGGAKKWHAEYGDVLRGRQVVVLPDNDEKGRQHEAHVRAALTGIVASGRTVVLPGLPETGDVSNWLAAGGTREQLEALVVDTLPWPDAPPPAAADTPTHREPWARAMTAAVFVAETDPVLDWLESRLLAPGSLTEWFSPRGLGKTQVAMAIAVKLARVGHRVLYLDRDNSRREIRRRLRAWGAADLTTLRVMTRDDVPPLTDRAAWKAFPFGSYELVIVDSFDASTEGIGEQDSAKPSTAIAPLLDIAHRADGPAILVLGNTIKSGAHGRSCGVTEDRADIVYEVRDATDLHPTGTKPWWTELPSAGREAWEEWATRRHRRDVYRLAFIASKFRIGEEPDPFVLEVNLSGEVWALREVTAEVEEAGRASVADIAQRRSEAETAAADRLEGEVARRGDTGESPLILTEAVEVLRDGGAPRDTARNLLNREVGKRWRLERDTSRHGRPWLVVGVNQAWPPEKELPLGEPPQARNSDEPLSPAFAALEPEIDAFTQSHGAHGVPEPPSISGDRPRITPRGTPDDALDPDGEEIIA
jgi:hypothetical protein